MPPYHFLLAFPITLVDPIGLLVPTLALCSLGGLFHSLFLMRRGQKEKGQRVVLLSLMPFLVILLLLLFFDK